MIVWTDPAVQAAAIGTIGNILAALIAATAAAIIGKRIADRDKLKENLDVAIGDISFLLGVEQIHCEMHKESSDRTSKMVVRQQVTARGLVWSGRFTPGRAKSLFKKL